MDQITPVNIVMFMLSSFQAVLMFFLVFIFNGLRQDNRDVRNEIAILMDKVHNHHSDFSIHNTN